MGEMNELAFYVLIQDIHNIISSKCNQYRFVGIFFVSLQINVYFLLTTYLNSD